MDKIVSLVEWVIGLLSQFPQFILALMARLLVGYVFLNSGLLKFKNWDGAITLFEYEYVNVPLPPVFGAYLAGYSEVIFGALLIIGFASRFSALALLVMTIVIQTLVYPESYMLHGLWAMGLIYIIKYGAGFISVDYFVKKHFVK